MIDWDIRPKQMCVPCNIDETIRVEILFFFYISMNTDIQRENNENNIVYYIIQVHLV